MISSTNIRYIACVISCISTLLSIYSVTLSFKNPSLPDKYGNIAIYASVFCLAVFCLNLLILMHYS